MLCMLSTVTDPVHVETADVTIISISKHIWNLNSEELEILRMHNQGLNVQGISGGSIYSSPNTLVIFLNKSFTQYICLVTHNWWI